MKKAIIAIIIVAFIAAAGIGSYFIFFNGDKDAQITAQKEDFVENASLLEAIILQPEMYRSDFAEEYGMSEEKSAEFFECPEEWLTYEQLVTIHNNSEENITVYGFEVENNGKNGVYLSTSIGGELSIAPGGHGPATVSVLFENGDLSIDEAEKLADKIKINVIYTKTPTEYDDGTESVEETKTAAVEIPEAK